jgi:hypothetical protein
MANKKRRWIGGVSPKQFQKAQDPSSVRKWLKKMGWI